MRPVMPSRTNKSGMPSSEPMCIFEKKFRNKPNRKIRRVRIKICSKSKYFEGFDSTVVTPTINRKNGKTKSVGVQPCHSACSNGGYTFPQSPGLFTIVINIMVRPRKTSSEVRRCFIKKRLKFRPISNFSTKIPTLFL